MLSHFPKLYLYNEWANRETLASLLSAEPPPPQALRFFNHVVAAELLWHTRLRRDSTVGFEVWPEWSVQECDVELRRAADNWTGYLTGLTTEMLLHFISYTNTKGERWQNTVSDVLTHVVIHSGYHRGQVAAAIRQAGRTPAYTDYIHAVRQEFIGTRIPDAVRR